MTFDRDGAPLKTYQVWTLTKPLELIEAASSFIARKEFAKKHQLHVTDCAARVFSTSKPRPICDHEFAEDVCVKCGQEHA